MGDRLINGNDAGACLFSIPDRLKDMASTLSSGGWPVGIVHASGGQYWAVIAATERYGIWVSVDLDLLSLCDNPDKFIALEGAGYEEEFLQKNMSNKSVE